MLAYYKNWIEFSCDLILSSRYIFRYEKSKQILTMLGDAVTCPTLDRTTLVQDMSVNNN